LHDDVLHVVGVVGIDYGIIILARKQKRKQNVKLFFVERKQQPSASPALSKRRTRRISVSAETLALPNRSAMWATEVVTTIRRRAAAPGVTTPNAREFISGNHRRRCRVECRAESAAMALQAQKSVQFLIGFAILLLASSFARRVGMSVHGAVSTDIQRRFRGAKHRETIV
jgi:hypothetical protein